MNPLTLTLCEAGSSATPFIALFTIFVLAMLYGTDLIVKVPPTLHTPLMSGSNAISGITIVGALIAAGNPEFATLTQVLAFIAVVMATINVVGGYLVTNRMLSMFKKKD
jgi:NAD(P) transhydrogenase subunit alpha